MEPWLCFGSSLLDTDTKYTLLGALLFLLLYLCYHLLKPSVPTIHRKKHILKRPTILYRKRRGELRGRRPLRKEAEEEQKLLSVVSSLLDKHPNTTRFRKLLCLDPLCQVCSRTAAEASHLLSQASVKVAATSGSPLVSKTPVKKSSALPNTPLSENLAENAIPAITSELSPTLSSTGSPDHALPLETMSPLETKFVAAPLPLQQLASNPPPLEHQTWGIGPVLQHDSTCGMTGRPSGLSTHDPLTRELSCRELDVMSPLPCELVECEAKWESLALHSSEASSEGVAASYHIEPGNLSFIRLDVLAFLETQIKKRGGFLMWKERESKTDSCTQQDKLGCQLNSVGKVLESVDEQQELAASLPFGSSNGKQGELPKYIQAPSPNPYKDHSQQKSIQLFWGLPSLHSESLSSTVPGLGDYSLKFVFFNIISNIFRAHKSPVIPDPKLLPLPEIQSQVLPETLHQDLLGAQAQAQLQSLFPGLPSSPEPQVSACGVCFHGLQSEVQLLTPSEIHHLEYNILQKKQENVWGLPSVVQRSQEDFCFPAPKLPLVRQYSKAKVMVSILPGDFPLTSGLQQKLEHHLRKRLIQQHWGLPRRIQESLSLMSPRIETPQSSESKISEGLSWISSFKHQKSKHPNFESSQLESSEKSIEISLLDEEVGKEQRHSPETGPKDHLSTASAGAPHHSSQSQSESNSESVTGSVSGSDLSTSLVILHQKQFKDALEVHWNKKFTEIKECQVPGTVNGLCHSNSMHLPLCEKSPSQKKQRDLAPLVGKESSLDTPHDISFPDSSKPNIVADRIKFFQMKTMQCLPQKTQESIETTYAKEGPSWVCSNSKLSSPSTSISGVDSKLGVSQSFAQNSVANSQKKMGTTNSASPVSKKGQGFQRQLLSDTNNEYIENLHRMKDGRWPFLHPTHGVPGHHDHVTQSTADNMCSPNVFPRTAMAAPDADNKKQIFKQSIQRTDEKRIHSEKNSLYNNSKETFKTKEFCDLPSQAGTNITNESKASLVTTINQSKAQGILTTKKTPMDTLVHQGPELSDLKNGLFNELKLKLESRKTGKAQGLQDDLPLESDNSKNVTLLTLNSSVTSVDIAASHELHAQLDKTMISGEQGQKPCTTSDLHKGQDKNSPQSNNGMSPPTLKSGKFGGGDTRLGTSQLRKRSRHPQNKTSKEMSGRTSHVLLQKGQSPPENHFRNHMKQFFQWFSTGKNGKRQESSLGKGNSPSSSAQARSLGKGKATFSGNTENQKVTRDTGKVPVAKQGQGHGVGVTCPQEPLLSPMKSGKTQLKAELETQTNCRQGKHPNKASCSKVTCVKSHTQEAASPRQSYLEKDRQGTGWHKEPTKSVLTPERRHLTAMEYREPGLHSRPTCRQQVPQVPLATPTIPNGSVLGVVPY
ncbi:PREDICTED: spermatogenesis-associated protein 31D1-like [Dipodomys ordii]|uniref:Spermatogenesis-associated protein 31D1-like n=1 Tax=Dipodomys ordii TaxID=10020 RepID=A0A1S3FC53_DIPOR|nr:PREDICTED: spermatogenesis-associated protein 31D1-like [Dipodomys ordii]